ncbi:MAG: DUF2892 domain-containing protein [Acidobacteriota bacterium]
MHLNNLQPAGRGLRITLGVALLILGWALDTAAWPWAIPLRIFGLYPLITGLVGWSPVRSLLDSSKAWWIVDTNGEDTHG